MDRDSARKAAEVMLAYAEGKEIETEAFGQWGINYNPKFNWGNNADSYRIKPTPTYRPFNNAWECWEEMQKHEPFGWVKSKDVGDYYHLGQVNDEFDKEYYFLNFTFPDGSVFGKQTEEG